MTNLNRVLVDHFRCPDGHLECSMNEAKGAREGYFRFGSDIVCYEKLSTGVPADRVTEKLHDALGDVKVEPGKWSFPFDPAQAIENLRCERYVGRAGGHRFNDLVQRAYYGVRPFLPITTRKWFQRAFLTGRMNTPFPGWPVDRSVDRLLERLLALSMKAQGLKRMPFIWFWPEGLLSAAIMTHDVETSAGVSSCSTLMDLDEQHGVKSSFQFVPEVRYSLPSSLLCEVRSRGFEVNLHDFNHDGLLYQGHEEFLRRAAKINAYARQFRAKGFRAAVLYRNADWYDAFDFRYDMSIPNVGHLDPQRGGCCTVMPYFIGRILELPVTTIQDYPLFHFLGEYSIDLWIRQINLIREGYGLISFIAHPDYLSEPRARKTYTALLEHLVRLRSSAGVWIALPREVDSWWRDRSQMHLVRDNGTWRIEGPGKERARIAYASLENAGGIRYTVESRRPDRSVRPAKLFG